MSRARLAVLAILTLLLGATGLAGPAAAGGGNERPRPIQIDVDLTFEIGGPAECDVAAGFLPTVLDGGGHASHLGRLELEGGGCANFAPGSDQVGQLDGGFVRYRAANGDELELSFTGQLDVDFITGTFTGGGTLSVEGGSGRFTSATGALDWSITGLLGPAGGAGTIVGDGWIAYDASDRSR